MRKTSAGCCSLRPHDSAARRFLDPQRQYSSEQAGQILGIQPTTAGVASRAKSTHERHQTPNMRELYDLVAKQKPLSPGRWSVHSVSIGGAQHRSRKMRVIAFVAAIIVGLGAFAILRAPGKDGTLL